MGRAGFNLLHVQYPLEAALQDGAGCGLGDDYEFVLRVPEHGPNHKDLVVEFLGGGGCWNYTTCNATTIGWQGQETTRYWMSQNLLAPTKAQFGASLTMCRFPLLGGGIRDFCKEENPYRTWTYLSLSYCTGDQHLGNNIATYSDGNGNNMVVRHLGAVNVDSVLTWARQLFPDLQRIHVIGESAGGWATFAWARQVAHRWPQARVAGWSDSALHLLCPSPVCHQALPMVDDSWNAINHLVAPPSSQLLTADAIRKPGWSLADLMVEALEELGGRLTFGVFTRSADAYQRLYWSLFGGHSFEWTSGMVALVNEMERRLPPSLLRTYVVSGSDHCIHRSDDLWTLQQGGVRFIHWLGNLSSCSVPAGSARVWDPAVGSEATYVGDASCNIQRCGGHG
ncbi:unnamed protein product [Symbiodinium pilosum]|uniref:Uncharacterized protein n=1 Tax=Symbiodinium pilosum TaxID=2952 RepID=A0A812XKK2_SYMPI|nr:unnamed protein product [Symbiodinium pilosum]